MTAPVRNRVLGMLLLTAACSADVQTTADESPWAAREDRLEAVACPAAPADDPDQVLCSGTIPAVSSCFVALGSDRLRREIAQTFTVNREGVAGRVRLLLKRLQELPLDPAEITALRVEVRTLDDGVIPRGEDASTFSPS